MIRLTLLFLEVVLHKQRMGGGVKLANKSKALLQRQFAKERHGGCAAQHAKRKYKIYKILPR